MSADQEAKALARTVEDMRRRLRALERTGQLANASIEGGALTVVDNDGNLRTLIGVQPDNTVTVTDHNGPPPPVPANYTAEPHTAMVAVTWLGDFAEGIRADGTWGQAPRPSDFKHVEIHASQTQGYAQTNETQVATIASVNGGTVMVPLGPGTWYISLQAVTTSGTQSAKGAEVEVAPLPVEAPVRFYQDTRQIAYGGYNKWKIPLTYTPVNHSEHVYWNGVYQEGDRWTRDGDTVVLDDTDRMVKSGDRLSVEYAHRDLPGVPNFTPMPFLRCRSAYGSTPLPTGTQIGDTIIVATNGHTASIGKGIGQFHTKIESWSAGANIWLGVVTSLDPIEVWHSSSGGPVSNHGIIWTTSAALDGRYNTAPPIGGLDDPAWFHVPAPPGQGSGFIAIMLNYGWIGGGYGGWDFKTAVPGGAIGSGVSWNRSCSDGTYHNIASAWTNAKEMPHGVDVLVRNVDNGIAQAFIFGVTL